MSPASMSESAAAAFAVRQQLDDMQAGAADRGENELGDAVAPADGERLAAKIDQGDFDFAPIIGINRARRIDHSNAVFDRQAGAWPDLQLKALWQGGGKTGRNKLNAAGLEHNVFRAGGGNIHARRLRGSISRHGNILLLRRQEPAELHRNFLRHHMPRPIFLTIAA